MLIFNKNTEEGFGKITKNTKTVYIGLFGFFPYNRLEDLEEFITSELELEMILEISDIKSKKKQAIEVYNIVGGGRNDLGYVLTIPFKSEKEANDFITQKIKNSDHVNKKLFSDIEFIDAQAFHDLIKAELTEDQEFKKAEELFKEEIRIFASKMSVKYSNNAKVKELIKEMVEVQDA